jgi:hypothetical protein
VVNSYCEGIEQQGQIKFSKVYKFTIIDSPKIKIISSIGLRDNARPIFFFFIAKFTDIN